jgi:methyl-accepting chemotaxis protein
LIRRLQRLGLKWATIVSFSLALFLVLLSLGFLVPQQVARHLEHALVSRGETFARDVRRLVTLTPPAFQEEKSQAVAELMSQDSEVVFVAVLLCATDTCRPEEAIASSPSSPLLLQDTLAQWQAHNRQSPVWLTDGQVLVSTPTPMQDGGQGLVLVRLTQESIYRVTASIRRTVVMAMLLGILLSVALVWLVARVFILRPLSAMMSMASKLSEADLTGRVEVQSPDELGALAEALNRIATFLRETLGRIRGVSEGVALVIEQISRTGNTVSSGATTALSRVEETSTSMVQMMASLRGIAENVEVLYQSAEESSSSILEMAATNDEVAENVHAMAASVEETTSAIQQMAYSIMEVAKNVDDLRASTEDTSSSINEMDVSIGQVEMNANETAKLSEQVSKDAETGVEALEKTLTGIDKIKDSSQVALSVIESLGRRTSEIGNILNVIDDVAEQTNLLALNAAIIAAQAGEHGKGFAVVAEEIKDLAERTGASTKEIAELIRAVQEESRNAVAAVSQGVRNVDEGERLGHEAERALKQIFESANKSTMMVKAIARATVEQARGSKQVTGAIHRIAEAVQQINKATNEQATRSEQIMKGAEKMTLLTNHVQRSSQEQAHGSKQITRSIENINEMVTHLNRAQKEQTKGSEQVLKAVEQIKSVSEHQARSVRQLEDAIDALQKQAEVLRTEIRRFRV